MVENSAEDGAQTIAIVELFVELFVVSMNESKLPSKEQNDLIDALFAMREKHSGRTAAAGDAQ